MTFRAPDNTLADAVAVEARVGHIDGVRAAGTARERRADVRARDDHQPAPEGAPTAEEATA